MIPTFHPPGLVGIIQTNKLILKIQNNGVYFNKLLAILKSYYFYFWYANFCMYTMSLFLIAVVGNFITQLIDIHSSISFNISPHVYHVDWTAPFKNSSSTRSYEGRKFLNFLESGIIGILSQGLLYTWTEDLGLFFSKSEKVGILKNGSNITTKGAKGTKENRFFLIYSKMVGDTA